MVCKFMVCNNNQCKSGNSACKYKQSPGNGATHKKHIPQKRKKYPKNAYKKEVVDNHLFKFFTCKFSVWERASRLFSFFNKKKLKLCSPKTDQ